MHRFFLAAMIGLGALLSTTPLTPASARPASEQGAQAHVTPVYHDRYRSHVAPSYRYYRPWGHRSGGHWYRPTPQRYQPSHHHRPYDRHDTDRRDSRGWRQ